MFHVKRCVGIKSFSDAKWMKKRAAGKIKSFLIQQFFKNVGEVWASSPHLRSKLKLHNERKQKSKRESEESQLPLKLKGCNERQGFRGNCDSQASWGCAPALPNHPQDGFPKYPQYQNAKYKIETVDKFQKICYTER